MWNLLANNISLEAYMQGTDRVFTVSGYSDVVKMLELQISTLLEKRDITDFGVRIQGSHEAVRFIAELDNDWDKVVDFVQTNRVPCKLYVVNPELDMNETSVAEFVDFIGYDRDGVVAVA